MKAEDSVYTMYTNMAGDALKVLERVACQSRRSWSASEATIADVAVYGDVAYTDEAAIDLAPYPNVKAWMGRIEKLPGLQEVRKTFCPKAGRGLS